MGAAATLEHELPLEAMWHAYRAPGLRPKRRVELDPSMDGALLNTRYYASSRGQFLKDDPAFLSLGIKAKLSKYHNRAIRRFFKILIEYRFTGSTSRNCKVSEPGG